MIVLEIARTAEDVGVGRLKNRDRRVKRRTREVKDY